MRERWHPAGCACGICNPHRPAARRRVEVRVPGVVMLAVAFLAGFAVAAALHYTILAPGYVCEGYGHGNFTCARR